MVDLPCLTPAAVPFKMRAIRKVHYISEGTAQKGQFRGTRAAYHQGLMPWGMLQQAIFALGERLASSVEQSTLHFNCSQGAVEQSLYTKAHTARQQQLITHCQFCMQSGHQSLSGHRLASNAQHHHCMVQRSTVWQHQNLL